jgi:tight adherence protein B
MPGPLILDLVAALVQGGAAPQTALGSVGAALHAAGDPSGDDLLSASVRVGHPIGGIPGSGPELGAGEPAAAGQTARSPRAARGAMTTPVTDGADGDSGRLTLMVEEALGLAARSGLPPTTLIRRCAAEERRRQAVAQLRAVRRLEVLLVVPAGLCLLPAFILLGVAPMVLDLLLG